MTVDIHRPSIAVICNAWSELCQDIHTQSMQTALHCIDDHPSIQYILLAATHVDLNPNTQGHNAWYDNSKRVFVDEQGVDWVRRMWFTALTQSPASYTVSPRIRDHDYGGRTCMAIWEQWQLEWLLNHLSPQVENVWYFGAGLGVRRDPFGWAQLCDLIKYNHVKSVNILSHRLGMLNNTQNAKDIADTDFEYIDWSALDNWRFVDQDIVVKTDLEW